MLLSNREVISVEVDYKYILLYFSDDSKGMLSCMSKCHRVIASHIEQAGKPLGAKLGK